MQAMILAAGFGTRLKPYSLVRPKPLFPVLNKPLLLATVEKLQKAGFSTVIVNAHYLKGQITEALDGIPGVIVQEEEEVMGTGGGLRLALRSLSDEPVLVTNGDIYHSIDYRRVYESHVESESSLTMVLHDFPRFNTVSVKENKVSSFNKKNGTLLAYTGIQVIDPEILESIPTYQNYCIIDHYRNLLRKGLNIHGLILEDTNWTDMGTPADYLNLHKALIKGDIPVWPELTKPESSSVIDSRSVWEKESRIEEWACVGNSRVGAGSVIRRSVVWDDAEVKPGAELADCIVICENK